MISQETANTMEEERRFYSASPSSPTRSVLSRSDSSKYLTADEGNSDSDTYYESESPSVPHRSHVHITESTPLLMGSLTVKHSKDKKSSRYSLVEIK